MKKAIYSAIKRNLFYFAARHGFSIVRTERFNMAVSSHGLIEMLRCSKPQSPVEADFRDFCIANSKNAYSQYQQDLFALWRTNTLRCGTFIEFGAADGTTHSNTKMLELDYEWSGILIEPHPDFYKLAKINRPNSIVINGAVDPQYRSDGGTLEMVVADQLSSVIGYHDQDKHSHSRSGLPSVRVPYVNLNDLIEKHLKGKTIDFMSIDTEGSELDILKGLNFSKFEISCLCVEVNDRTADAAEITNILNGHGYRTIFDRSITREDIWFVRS